MKKLLTRVLIMVSVLLLGGQGTLFAKNGKAGGYATPVKVFNLYQDDTSDDVSEITKFQTSFSPYQKQADKIDPTDKEEEEESQNTASKKLSVKKTTDLAAHYFTAAFSVPTPEYHYTSINKRTDNYKRFSYSISNRWYILFRVIRI